MANEFSKDDIKKAVKEHYGKAISSGGGCCGGPSHDGIGQRFVKISGYTDEDLAGMPEGVTSFGCGNPVNFIEVSEGQTVLDLGSGAGMDLILAARKVGPGGKAIGLDMTDEMIDTCKRNIEKAGLTNAEVRKGEMEAMPVADQEVDWIISNCVINLSPEKEKVFAEAFRVLKPGGRMLVSDIVTSGLPEADRRDMIAWVGCIAGAVEEDEYLRLVREAGFEEAKVVDRIAYEGETLSNLANEACGCGTSDTLSKETIDKYSGKVLSVKVSARKPG